MAVAWPEHLFPLLLVNMGSGVSVVRVDGEDHFARVGGTACGGATFLGLARALTGLRDFHEMLSLAAQGDNRNVDKTVGDIYGSGVQPYVLEAATLCARGCNPMCSRLQPYARQAWPGGGCNP